MQWIQNQEQKRAILLVLEAMKLLHDKTEDALSRSHAKIKFATQALLFWKPQIQVMKTKWSDLRDSERISLFSHLDYCEWGTNDYDALSFIQKQVNETGGKYKEEIKLGKRKHIIVVMTDGISWNMNALEAYLYYLREMWVCVYAIWLTQSWWWVIDAYKSDNKLLWEWIICKNPQDLSQILHKLLLPHLNIL
jgi:hypothetical protein